MSERKSWHDVLVATVLPCREDFTIDFDAFAEYVKFLADNGCDGVAPKGPSGEYQTLSDEERARVITTAVHGGEALSQVAKRPVALSARFGDMGARPALPEPDAGTPHASAQAEAETATPEEDDHHPNLQHSSSHNLECLLPTRR